MECSRGGCSNIVTVVVLGRMALLGYWSFLHRRVRQVDPTGLRFINFLNPPFFCSVAVDSGENEDGTWLISSVGAEPPYELKPPTELFAGSDGGGGVCCGM